jgi:hypothetical protein
MTATPCAARSTSWPPTGRAAGGHRRRPTSWRPPSSAIPSCTTCCWASTRSSSAARRLRWPPTAPSRCGRWRSISSIHRNARIYVLPCIAGHVGADTAGVVLAERPDLSDEVTLLVDVGTNAEIVLGNNRRLLACSSPTGPAFEGAQISCGQRAAPGAIERVRIDGATLEPRFKVIGCDLWSDDPGFAAATGHRRDRHLRLGHHRDPGRAVPGRRDPPRRRDQRRTGRAQPAHPERRADLLL